MSLNAAALKLLHAKGLSTADIIELAEAMESTINRSQAATRQARYRAKKKAENDGESVTSDVTGDVTNPPNEYISNPPSSEAKASGCADPIKQVFDLGVSLLTEAGTAEKQARSLVGKWRKSKGDAAVLQALLDCRARSISNPVEWIEGRFKTSAYVSASGYEYRGDVEAVIREAEKRGDWSTYYQAKQDRDGKSGEPISFLDHKLMTAGGR